MISKKKLPLFSVLSFMLILTHPAMADSALKLIKVVGSVNRQEIGGSGLSVFSLWADSRGSPVLADGVFETVVSDAKPQKISLRDSNNLTRAIAIVLPEVQEKIVFDAQSTAAAILFSDPGLLVNSAKVKGLIERMHANEAFQELVDFLKKKLPHSSLEGLINNPECRLLIEKCNADIFGVDSKAILESLRVAKGKLEESFKHK